MIMTQTWTSVLAHMGIPTGDGRIIAPGALTNRDLPLPLLFQRMSSGGHDGSVVVGRIEEIEYGDDGAVTARGSMLDAFDSMEATELIRSGVIGPSVDLDDMTYVVDDQDMVIITEARIAGATLVSIPAFANVSITLDEMEPEPEIPEGAVPVYIVASVRSSGWSDMPIADESHAWEGSAAADRVLAWATEGDTTDWSRYARAFLRRDDDADPETKGAYSFGIADVIDGTLTIVPRGVFAAAAAVQGARSGEAPEEAEAMKSVLRGIYDRMDREAPFALVASATNFPPSDPSWFANPNLTGPMPLTVFDNGQVFGHLASWDTCHVGFEDCRTAPSSPSGYAYYLTHEERTTDGVIPVGVLSVGGGHADPNLGFMAAVQHYDDVSTAVAHVVVGEDAYGIWAAGRVLPWADPVKVEQFRSSPISGDWRRIGGALELIAACSVNTPGFPIPRARARAGFTLVAGTQQMRTLQMALTQPVAGSTDAPLIKTYDDKAARAKWAWVTKGR